MLNIYKITSAGPKADGGDLLGLLIIQSSEGFMLSTRSRGSMRHAYWPTQSWLVSESRRC